MIRFIITFILFFTSVLSSLAQYADYIILKAEANNPSSLMLMINTTGSKKKKCVNDAAVAALNAILFEGIPASSIKPIMSLSGRSNKKGFLDDLFSSKVQEYVRSTRMISEYEKSENRKKSTDFEVVVDYSKLRADVSSVMQSQGVAKQKKPTLMILPSDNWCSMRLFTTTYDNQGVATKIPNYVQAFQDDAELSAVISKVGGVLTNLGYSLKDAEQSLKTLNNRQAEDNITMSKNSGSTIAESPLDNLKKVAKADIIIQLWWKVNKESTGKSVSFTLESFDAYTNKRLGSSSGTGPVSSEIVPVLLEQAVLNNISDFDSQMTAFYDDINANGREIVLNVKRWDDWEHDLETDFDGNTLLDIIEDWLNENTVNSSFNLSDASENFAMFEQVRIPLNNEKGRALDARNFVLGLQKHLKTKYEIPSKLMVRGLGETNLIIGEQ